MKTKGKYHKEAIRTPSELMCPASSWENVIDQVKIGFSFACDWLGRLSEFL